MISGALSVAQLGKVITHAFRASRIGRYTPLMVWGEAGVGKSESVARAAHDLGVGFKDLRLGLFEAPDLLGVFRQQEVYPCFLDYVEGAPRALRGKLYTRYALYAHVLDRHADAVRDLRGPDEVVEWAIDEAKKRGLGHLFSIRTVNAPPSWLPQPGTAGILFLDEANRAQKEVRQGSFQLVLDRVVGQIPLPSRWIIVSANNPPDTVGEGMGYRVSRTDDRAFLSRFCHLAVEPTSREWLAWARRAGVDPRVRAFLAMNGANYLGSTRPIRMHAIDPSPRSWAMLSNLVSPVPAEVEGAPAYTLDDELVTAVASGLVGVDATRAWFAFRTVPDPLVTSTDLLKDYDSAYARLLRFLRYPWYDPKTRQPRLGEDGQPIVSKRSDLVRVAFETVTDALREAAELRASKPAGYHPQFGNVRLIAVAFRLMSDGYKSEIDGGLGMKDVATQYAKLWLGQPKGKDSKQLIQPTVISSTDPAVVSELASVGMTKQSLMEVLREYGALVGNVARGQ